MIGPDASASGLARRSSSRSATSRIFSSSSSRPVPCFAETCATCVVPPHSSGCSPWAARSESTRSGFAPGRSILLTATTIGTSAARACEIDSSVCGITLSSAATTRTAMSVTFAPRARMAVNASWPGVSRNVIFRPSTFGLVGADVLRDPAGLGLDDRRLADRVEERRLAVVDVAHDRDDGRPRVQRLLGVVERLRLGLLLACVLDRHLAAELGRDQLDLVVGERLGRGLHRPHVHQHLDDLRHPDPERLREVAHRDARLDGDGAGRRRDLARRLRLAVAALAVAGPLPLARAGTAGAAVDDDAPPPVAGASAPSWSDRSTAWQDPRLSSSCSGSSVEPRECVLDADGRPQRAVEAAMRSRALEALRAGGTCRRPAPAPSRRRAPRPARGSAGARPGARGGRSPRRS